ncbi:amino acid adenylation domain-containing protein [Kitasatospora sp. NPDC094011]|uniref:amino acid adenylation domain-containing protein n=1 Tax=Kitasatospora sp. NPDC094011 TaxID=3364090 RepID=UPI0038054736
MTETPVFTETFTVTSDNPLLGGHVVQGRPLMPGVGHVELVLEVLARHGHPMAETVLRSLTILTPLVALPGAPVAVTIEGRAVPAGGLRVEVCGRPADGGAEVLHVTAAVERCAPGDLPGGPTSSAGASDGPATTTTSLDEMYAWCRAHDLAHSGLMKSLGTVRRHPGAWTAELELGAEHRATAGRFLFHPALFEAALLSGGVATGLLASGEASGEASGAASGEEDAQGFYLPLAFESFRATGPLGDRCSVRIPAESVHRTDELIRMSLEFHDATGRLVAELGGYVAKRVRTGAGPAAAAEAAAEPTAHRAGAKGAVGTTRAELQELLRELVAARLGVPPAEVGANSGYYQLGLASAALVGLVTEIEDRISVPLSPTVVFEYTTIAELAGLLETLLAERGAPVAVADPTGQDADLTAEVSDEVSRLLGLPVEQVDPDAEFAELGFDLVGRSAFVERLNDRYGLALTAAVLSAHPTVRGLAAHLLVRRGEQAQAGPQVTGGQEAARAGRPHPMLHRRVPAEDGVEYRSRFDGDEPYLRDHRVRGARLLPGVAHLEMARAAVAAALDAPSAHAVRLEDVVWLRPAICGPDGLELRVAVRRTGDTAVFEITVAGDDTGTPCCQGRARLVADADRELPDLARVRAECAGEEIPAARVYGLYADAGLDYGPAQRALAGLRPGVDPAGNPQVLAELRLPAAADPLDDCVLHPAVLDGALQATAGLWLTADGVPGGAARPALPFAVARVDTVGAASARAFAWVRYRRGSGPDAAQPLLDVTVFDEAGRVSADLTGLSTRALPPAPVAGRTDDDIDRDIDRDAVHDEVQDTDIAVIGIAGRYPGAADLAEFWDNLRSGRDSVGRVPAGRWRRPAWLGAEGAGTADVQGGFLDGIDLFDPLFFQISLREAEYLDPHERLFLECAHHVLEDAGYTGELLNRTSGDVGVFTGVMYQDYQLYGAQAQQQGHPVALSASASSVANRVSYSYGFTGPSLAVDTMCSSSLTAVHLACEAIRSGRCGAAIAGGVNVTSHPAKYLMLGQRNFLSSDGRCRSFGAGGDGYVPGEGVGAVLLKPLARALADGDHVHAVIKGTAVNHGGRTTGYTVPSPAAQGRVIGGALAASGVDPRALGYVEAHGTGTALGDPIEIAGLVRAFQEAGVGPADCAIGSVKSNIGHAESAAGIAGITKVLLQLRHRQLAPSLHARTLNPHIDFSGTPLHVQQVLAPWQRPVVTDGGLRRTLPRTAGVSSFGAGGTNAHVLLAEYEPPTELPTEPSTASTLADGRPALIVLSARTEDQLREQARRLRDRLAELDESELPGVAWTLQTGRTVLEERLAFAAGSLAEASALLTRFAAAPEAGDGWVRGTVPTDPVPADAELAAALDAWAATATTAADRLLRLWAEGTPVPWETVQRTGGPERRPRRVPLPGYPFARERCWIELDGVTTGGEPWPVVAPERAPAEVAVRLVAVPPAPAPAPEGDTVVLLSPGWAAGAPTAHDGTGAGFAAHHVAVVGTLTEDQREALRAALPAGADCRFVELVDGPADRRYGEAVREVFTLVQEVLRTGVPRPVLFQVALAHPTAAGAERERLACLRGLTGLLRSAGQENPQLRTQLVDCLDGADPAVLAARLAAEVGPEPAAEVRYRDGRRYTAVLSGIATTGPAAAPWREDGVYLITGGVGALGLIVAGDLAAAVRHATVVLVGRSAATEEQRAAMDALRAAGLTVDHRRADLADRASVAALLAGVRADHGALTGILHGAGVIEDRLITGKSPAGLARVLAPKVAGLIHLDELSSAEPLEFLACLSSASGAFGNLGQADYAAANAFMDTYAVYRNLLVAAGERKGRTVSIGWPLWAEGGMGTGEAVTGRLRAIGLAPLDTERGLDALHRALTDDDASGDGRVIVLAGQPEALSRITGQAVGATAEPTTEPTTEPTAQPADTAGRLAAERAVPVLRRTLAEVLKLAPERLNPAVPLERYGMDSVLAVAAVGQLEDAFGPLARTLLFERPTLNDLAEYLATEYPVELRALLGESAPEATPAAPAAVPTPAVTNAPAITNAPAPAAAPRPAADDRSGFRDIAVIGMAGSYPQAEDLDTLWAHLRAGRDCVTEPPADRWEGAQGSGAWGGFLDGIDRFDPGLFGIAPREAAVMDPQQRLFLETVWRLLEDGGVTQEVIERQYRRRVGVYVGAAYQLYRADASDPALAALTATASFNLIANRVSHFFGLEGPSLAVDSMCTSSAMAIHLACADLQRGESELAVAGGVNLAPTAEKFRALSEMRMLGSHPGSRSFRDGDGYLPAEAVGAVLLKPLDAALRDGDTVHAVIKGTASVHSGHANGFLTPSRRAQITVMRRALERAGAAPESIGYVESSANGTTLSDEIELSALREVFDGSAEPVVVGAVKSNLGHPEAATGVAQLTKVALQFRHRELAPLTGVGKPNPNLDLGDGPLTLCERLTPWEQRQDADGRPVARRALINSVAAGGSHVTLVVEAPPEAVEAPAGPVAAGPQVVVVSAVNASRLRTTVARLAEHLGRAGAVDLDLAEVAYTLQLGREAMPERLAVVAGGVEELRTSLDRFLAATDGTAGTAAPGTPSGGALYTGNAEAGASPLMAVFEGARGEVFLSALVADRDLERLAELWVAGARIPWAGLHPVRRRLLPLPGTAFERRSYWLARLSASAPATPAPATPVPAAPATPVPAEPAVTTAPEPTAPEPPAGKDRTVLTACAELLGYAPEELAPDDNFLALGGHSLLAYHLAALLRERGLHCEPSVILRARSLAAVAEAAEELPTAELPTAAAEQPTPAGIPEGTTHVTPAMLPLVPLTEDEVAAVVAAVPGGAGNLQDVYPLAPLQEGMFFHYVREGEHDPYVSSGLFSFKDRATLDRFADALAAVVARHDALRTVILSDGLGAPVQAVLRRVDLAVEEVGLTSGTPAAEQLTELLRTAPRMPLHRAPLIRLRAGRHPDTGGWHAAMSLHHVVHDASSLGLLFAELVAHMEDGQDALPAPVPYRDFIAHTRRRPADLDPAAFFAGMLGEVSEPSVLFRLDDVHGDGQQVVELSRPLDEELGRRVRALAADLLISPATLFHAGWALTVAACTDRDDAVFGTVMSGRLQGPAGMERMLGSFINTLPMRLDLTGRSVRELVRETGELLHQLVRHEQIPLTEARAHSGLARPELPLFNAIFNYRHLPSDDGIDRLLDRVGVTPLSGVHERSNFPVTVSVDDLGREFRIDALIHRAQPAEVVVDCLEAAVAALVDALSDELRADGPAVELSVLPPAMRHRELVEYAWTPATAEEPAAGSEQHVHVWFEEVVRRAPDAVAVRCEDRELTYAELNARANRLARHLRELGVGPDELVALCLPRSEWIVVAALAVLKAGGAYVPLDPTAPAERLGHVVRDSAPRVLLVDGVPPEGLDAGAAAVVDVPGDAGRWDGLPDGDLEPLPGASPANLAYVIYTSGSTGLPKGVMVEHRNMARYFLAMQEWFGYRPDDVWTLFHSVAFDFTIWEIWGALLNGSRLVVVTQDVARSPKDFYRLLCAEGVTVLGQTPTGFGQLIAAQGEDGTPHRVRSMVIGGEELDASPLRPWFERPMNDGTVLVNMWGTTETTVVSTYREVVVGDTVLSTRPIGGALPGLGVYVLDRHGNPVPTGAVGELYIGGEVVARGYLNRPELSAVRYLHDPFREVPGARMYRTGDLGRRLPDGSLEFLGRNDDQVKIRGYRIELGEITVRLNEHPAVEDARVVVRGEGDDRRLVGYLVPSARRAPDEEVLREELDAALRAVLPPYMVPSGYVVLERLPLTVNGKLDTRALPEPAAPQRSGDHGTAPSTEAERIVSEVWAELLRADAGVLGTGSDFFALGGNSLLVTRVINLIKQRTGVELNVKAVFAAHTLGALAAEVAKAVPDAGTGPELDLDTIFNSISAVENMTDAELDALDLDNAVLDIES